MDFATKFEYWSLLTPEIKSRCLTHLDFVTRIKFRNMSQSDRAVVNFTKFPVQKVSITNDSYGEFLEIDVSRDDKFKMMAEDETVLVNQMVPLFSFVMKCGIIEELICDIDDLPEPAINALRECGQIRFKTISGRASAQNLLFLEQCLGTMVEAVSLSASNNRPVPFDRIMAINSLRSVKRWDLGHTEEADCCTQMARRWIEVDAEIGSELNITVPQTPTAYMNFRQEFRGRVIEEEYGTKIRITMNPEKHISLQARSPGKYQMWIRSGRSRSPPRIPRFRIV